MLHPPALSKSLPASFRDAFKQQFGALTPAQKKLATYIDDNSETAAFATAKQIGVAVGQSDAAVVRLSRALGFSGFPEMRSALREGLLERVGASGLRVAAGGPTTTDDLKQEVFSSDTDLIARTAQLTPNVVAESVALRLVAARRIWVIGHGTTYPMALLLSMHLNQILGNCEALTVGHGDIADRIRHITARDVVIGIGYARYLPYTLDLMHAAADYGAHVIAITDKTSSPLAHAARDAFIVARESASFGWWSQTGTLSLINWLVSLTMARHSEHATHQLQQGDLAWERLRHWQADDTKTASASLAAPLSKRLAKSKASRNGAAPVANEIVRNATRGTPRNTGDMSVKHNSSQNEIKEKRDVARKNLRSR